MNKAIFKFNGGNGALLCSKCNATIKTGRDFTDDEWDAMRGRLDISEQFCKICK